MRSPKKTPAIMLAGAVGLSAVAYGIGSQAGDGSSVAAAGDNAGAQRGCTPRALRNLAQRLGVEADALHDYREQQHGEIRSAFATALADALGKSPEDVQSALNSLKTERRARFAGRLAQALGVDSEAVTTALDELEQERPEPGGFAAALAEKLGVEADDVEAALRELRPRRRATRRGHPHVALRGLAAELDVTRAELREALREVRAGADVAPGDRRADLVDFLAERFDLSEDEVDEALPGFPGRGPGGPHGPGAPGPGPRGWGGPGGPPGMP